MKRTPTRKEDGIRVEHVLHDERSMDISGGCPELRHELAVALAAAVATGGRWLKFLRYWEEKKDENCMNMPVLTFTKNIFIGFKD